MSSNDEIDLKQLGRKFLFHLNRKKRIFTILFVIIMLIATAYFVNIVVAPSYKSEVVLKSRYVSKDQLQNIINKYNIAIGTQADPTVSKNMYQIFNQNHITNFSISEIKPDTNNNDKDPSNSYSLTTYYSTQPSSSNVQNTNAIIDNIKEYAAEDNEITAGKKRTEAAIKEVDSLIKVAFVAGDEFKNRLNNGTGSMVVMNDLYKSLNDIIKTKKDLQTELFSYKKNNVIYKASPIVVNKSITFPYIVFLIALIIWGIICFVWLMGEMIFGD